MVKRHTVAVLYVAAFVFASMAVWRGAYAEDAVRTANTSGLRIPFSETTVHPVGVHPQNPNLLRIARISDDVGTVTSADWCGSRLLMFGYGFFDPVEPEPPSHGGFLVDVASRKTWRLGELAPGERVMDCTRDGQWFIYFKRVNQGKDVVLGRYHIETGRKEDFLRFNNSPYLQLGLWSPDGKKIYFGRKENGVVLKTADPVWQIIWGKPQFSRSEVAWLGDATGLLVKYQSDPNDNKSDWVFAIYRFDDAGGRLETLDAPIDLRVLAVDGANRVYGIRGQVHLSRCTLRGKALQCEPAIADDPEVATIYDFLPDGSAIFYTDRHPARPGTCLWRYEEATRQSTCLWGHGVGTQLHVSPDGRSVAFSTNGLYPPDKRGATHGFAVLRVGKD